MQRKKMGIPWLGIFNVLGYVFLLLPIVAVLVSSFSEMRKPDFPPAGGVTYKWYFDLGRWQFISSFWYSVILGLLATFAATILGTFAALALVRYRFPGRDAIQTFLMTPLILPRILIGISLLQFYTLLTISAGLPTLLAGHVIVITPYVMRLVASSLARFDRNLELAARNLGANPWEAFRRITLPLIMPGVVAGAAFAFIVSFDDVTMTIFLTTPQIVTLPVRILMRIDLGLDTVVMAAGSLGIFVAFLLMVFFEKTIGIGKIFGVQTAR
ncbi:MAG: ABC transporter permease [Chloroflexi bacterium]|nr:ABC transporter permease [Chloroflexota bacterium]